jgi:hypothetical protein
VCYLEIQHCWISLPDYDEDRDQLEEQQEEESDEITPVTTTNEVF